MTRKETTVTTKIIGNRAKLLIIVSLHYFIISKTGESCLWYNYIDPAQLRISIGHNTGLATQTPYGVKGNTPDFKDIGVKDGLIKYELVALKDLSSERGYITEDPLIEVNDETRPLGTILVQLTNGNTLEAEIFL